MRRLSLILISILTVVCAYAADVKVTGTVISASDGDPIIGASVTVKGSKAGVSTDIDGRFAIMAPVGSKLSVEYIGYKPAEYNVSGAANGVIIELRESTEMLD
jgi:hypothetical protein